MLTEFDWGEYIIWELNGNCRVAIDGRYETVYPEYVAREYFEFAEGGPYLRKYLDKYPHDLILLQHDNYICESSASNQTGSKYTLTRTAYFSCGTKSRK